MGAGSRWLGTALAACLGAQASHGAVAWAEPPVTRAAEPTFPILPLYTAVAAAGMVFAGVSLHLYGAGAQRNADSLEEDIDDNLGVLGIDALDSLAQDVERMQALADDRRLGGTLFLIGGAVALTTSVLLYVALEPEGGWTWSLTREPAAEAWGVRVTRAF